MASQATYLTVQFLSWVASRPRTRAELREAWQSTCPLNSPWEDAVAEELVAFGPGGHVVLTEKGRQRLGGRADPAMTSVHCSGGPASAPSAAPVAVPARNPPG